MKQACAGKARRILKGREKLWVNPPPGGEGKALLRLAHRANRPQTLNLISGLLENATSFVLMGTTLNRVPEVIIVLFGSRRAEAISRILCRGSPFEKPQ